MKITDAIAAEHAALRQRFAEVEEVLPKLETAAEVGAMAALLEGLLGSHAELETDLAFLPLDRALEQKGRVSKLAQDHEEIDERLKQARRATNYAEGCRILRTVLHASRLHFLDEERILLPALERALPPEVLHALGRSFEKSRQVMAESDEWEPLIQSLANELPKQPVEVAAPKVKRLRS